MPSAAAAASAAWTAALSLSTALCAAVTWSLVGPLSSGVQLRLRAGEVGLRLADALGAALVLQRLQARLRGDELILGAPDVLGSARASMPLSFVVAASSWLCAVVTSSVLGTGLDLVEARLRRHQARRCCCTAICGTGRIQLRDDVAGLDRAPDVHEQVFQPAGRLRQTEI